MTAPAEGPRREDEAPASPQVIEEEEIHEEVKPKEVSARDAANWAKQISTLKASEVPEGALNVNVTGRRVTSPIQGFGKMWQKTYRITLGDAGIEPQALIEIWKQNFQKFWPERNYFYGPVTGIAPGEVATLNLSMPGRLKLSTGVLVLYADEESFTFMTPEGHGLAGWITFSSFKEGPATAAQVQVLMRASDPIAEIGMALIMHKREDRFWQHTLRALADHIGAPVTEVDTQVVCVDDKRQWSRAKNVWKSAAVGSALYVATKPFRRKGS